MTERLLIPNYKAHDHGLRYCPSVGDEPAHLCVRLRNHTGRHYSGEVDKETGLFEVQHVWGDDEHAAKRVSAGQGPEAYTAYAMYPDVWGRFTEPDFEYPAELSQEAP